MQETRKAGWQNLGLIAGVGFFALASQTLLFRVFLTVFEGNELGIACFFGSWLTWVAVGAICGRSSRLATVSIVNNFEFLPLLYLPAGLLQWWLLTHARELAGVRPYELLPLFTMLPVSFLCIAPVSFCTGLLFTLACRWMQDTAGLPVARVYTWETIGSVIGGVAVTVLLAAGVSGEMVFLLSALLLTLLFAACRLKKRSYLTAAVPVLAVAAALCSGIAARWEAGNDLRTWKRVLSSEVCRGSFTTPEARYLYGEYGDQFNVVAWETVADTIPATEHASEIIALHLAQRPGAKRFVVAGRGAYSICLRLLELPQVETITWLDPDPAYRSKLLGVLPDRLKSGKERLDMPPGDMRRWLETTKTQYDVIILNFTDATTLALNRYFTREYFRLLKALLGKDGVLGVRISAGENFMSGDRVNVGASVLVTLRAVFRHLAIKPGEESWLLASDSPGLTTAPALLRDRFAGIKGAERIYPPDGLMALYQPLRIEYEMQCFETAARNTPGDLLLNTDRSPRALLHSLLFAARETGGTAGLGTAIRTFALHGAFVLPLGLLLFPLLRLVFVVKHHGAGPQPGSTTLPVLDNYALVFTTGAAGMGSSIVLMYLYQSAFGSIFLHIGLISALCMMGLAAGSVLASRLLSASDRMSTDVLRLILPAHILMCGAILLLSNNPTQAGFAVAFVLSGLFGGFYVPIAASRMNAAGMPPATAGSLIETIDHLGGAAGGFLAGLIILPVFGTTYSLLVLALLLACNVVALRNPARAQLEPGPSDPFRRRVLPLGYALFGVAVFAVAAGLLLRRSSAEDARQVFVAFAQSAAGRQELQARQRVLGNGRTLDYFCTTGAVPTEATTGESYIFQTDSLSPDVTGYGGPITLALVVDVDGTLRDARVLRSDETPSYLDFLKPWLQRLIGRNIFEPAPLKDVDAVTGATLTSTAVLRILRKAGPAFAVEALGKPAGPTSPAAPAPFQHKAAIWLAFSIAAALALRARPSRWPRRGLLLLVVVLSGFVFNIQYSLAHVFSLIGLSTPPPGWGIAFLLVAGIPALVVLFGNIYCGYLCPFGAIQELIGDLRPSFLRTDPDKTSWSYARLVKYVLLALLVILFGVTLQAALASGDPLVTVFARERGRSVLILAGLLLTLAFFYPRFWCRTLCPAGAFLALLNGIRPVNKLRPAVFPASCVYGVRGSGDMDCLCCDRCRRPGSQERQAMARPARAAGGAHPVNAMLVAAAVGLAIVLSVQAVSAWRSSTSAATASGQAGMTGSGARPVDMRRLRDLIEQGKLSDKEALFYKTAAPAGKP